MMRNDERVVVDAPQRASNLRTHLMIGTAICLATMLLFVAFRDALPAMVPLQFRLDGSTANHVPRDVFVFGVPVAFAAANLFFGSRFLNDAHAKPFWLYIAPAIVVAIAVFTIWFTT